MFLCVLCLLNSDIYLTEMGGSDNIFVAVVLPEVFLQDSKCEVSLHFYTSHLHLSSPQEVKKLFKRVDM